jgi:hypothetical protein
MLKIILALLNTIISAGVIFYTLFLFGMAGGFREFESILKYGGMGYVLMLFIGIPVLIFGIIYCWVRVFMPFGSLTKATQFILLGVSIVLSVISIMVAR